MGKNRREKREEEREGFAAKRTAQYRTRNLKALGILSAIGVIVAFACFEFVTSTNNVPGAPENAGKLGDEHIHASLLVYLYRLHAIQDGDTIHRHSTGVELEFLFNSMSVGVDENCFVFPDGRQFCNNEDYSIKFYINDQPVKDIRQYVIQEDDRILISYGNEDQLAIDKQLAELNAQAINRL